MDPISFLGLVALVFISILAFTKKQDNDSFGQEVFQGEERQKNNATSNSGLFIWVVILALALLLGVGLLPV
jgi:hypothetical protein